MVKLIAAHPVGPQLVDTASNGVQRLLNPTSVSLHAYPVDARFGAGQESAIGRIGHPLSHANSPRESREKGPAQDLVAKLSEPIVWMGPSIGRQRDQKLGLLHRESDLDHAIAAPNKDLWSGCRIVGWSETSSPEMRTDEFLEVPLVKATSYAQDPGNAL